MVNAALNGIAQCPLSGYALLEIAAVGDILYITVFIVGGAVRLNEGYMVDRRGGLDGGKDVFVFSSPLHNLPLSKDSLMDCVQ